MEEKLVRERDPREVLLLELERCVYDVQKWRIAVGNRYGNAEALLTEQDRAYFKRVEDTLVEVEKAGTNRLAAALKTIPIWEQFLKGVKGIGPKMGALLVAETHIEQCHTVSKLWAWWGVHVVVDAATGEGHAARRIAGQKANFSPFRKAKLVKVCAESMLKKKSPPYYDRYVEYKHRKETQLVSPCMCCRGVGVATRMNDEIGKKEAVQCWNCGGTGGPAPWGTTPEHRHRAALRYMVKMFLIDFWRKWRELEGLPVPETYGETYQKDLHPRGQGGRIGYP